MTAEEAAALLTPEQQAWVDALVAAAPPLNEGQQQLLTRLFTAAEQHTPARTADVA